MEAPDLVILLVEDDENDQVFIRRALQRNGAAHTIVTVNDGEEAIAYLSGTAPFNDRARHPLPRLIVTDLKMPRMGGLELLAWLKCQADVGIIPTVVLTSSSDQADIANAFRRGASGYLIKPVHFAELEQLMRTVVDYWRASCVPRAGVR